MRVCTFHFNLLALFKFVWSIKNDKIPPVKDKVEILGKACSASCIPLLFFFRERKRQRECCIQIANQTKPHLNKLELLRQSFPWCQKQMKHHTSTHQKRACQWWVYTQSHSGTPPSRQSKKSQRNFSASTPDHAKELWEGWCTWQLNKTTGILNSHAP